MLGIVLFVGPFREGLSVPEKTILGLLCLLFGIAPVILQKVKSFSETLSDKKNMTLLGLGSLMLIYCISESFYYEFLSTKSLMAWFAGIVGFIFSIVLIIAPGKNQELSS